MKMNSALSFSIVLLVIIIFSFDHKTTLVADRVYKPSYRDFIVFEGKNKKVRGKNNYNEYVKKKILVVDDEPDLTFSFKEGLGVQDSMSTYSMVL